MNWRAFFFAWLIQFAIMFAVDIFLLWKFNYLFPFKIEYAIKIVLMAVIFIILDRKPDPSAPTQG